MVTIVNMHIRNDYSNWGVERRPRKRVTTMCGKMTLPKYAGIPGITETGPEVVDIAKGDYTWCIACSNAFLVEVALLQKQVVAINDDPLTNLYIRAVRIIARQIKAISRAMLVD